MPVNSCLSTLPKVPAGQLDIAVLGQLAQAQLPLRSHLEPGAVEMISLDALLRGRAMAEKALQDAPRNADDALVFPNGNPELDGIVFGVPMSVRRETEEHGAPRCGRTEALSRPLFLLLS
jgi:hypothetical protein